jgi:hypothetical protein
MAWTRVDDLYAEMALPAEDRIYRQPPDPGPLTATPT